MQEDTSKVHTGRINFDSLLLLFPISLLFVVFKPFFVPQMKDMNVPFIKLNTV